MDWSKARVVFRGGHVISSGRSVVRDVKMHQSCFVRALKEISVEVHTEGLYLTPGLIDIQINGFGGNEFVCGDGVVAEAQKSLPRFGVTSFLPTIGSAPIEKYSPSMLRFVIKNAQMRKGSEAIGWHLEGPFLNPLQSGIHRKENLLSHVDVPFWKSVFETGAIQLMTLAPEVLETDRLLEIAADNGVAIAIGHSQATEGDLVRAQQKGVAFVTHLFNAMAPFHHRSPGIIGAVLGKKMFGFTIISDLHHVCQEGLLIALKSHPKGLGLVSDGAPLIGTQVKKGSFLGVSVEGDGEKLMTVPNGTLAGSLIPLDEQVHRLMLATDCPFEGAVRAASEVPASFVNCSGRKGRIAVGFDADCVLWKQIDGQMQVVATFCRGELAFCRDEFWSRVDTLD